MEEAKFDRTARSVGARANRRGALGLLSAFALGCLGLDRNDAEAKKKKKKKKKKPACPSGQQRCGNACVDTNTDAANCGGCSNACAGGKSCQQGACQCASGFVQTCDGACIPDEPGLVVCCEPNILCEFECCDVAAAEVCHVSPHATDSCQAGGCPAGGLCQREDFYACAGRNALDIIGLCECTAPIEGGASVCVSTASLDCNHTCTSSSSCGAGAVCIANGEFCGCEETVVGFCGTLCSQGCGANCRQGAPSRAHRQTGSAWREVLAPKLGGRERSHHR